MINMKVTYILDTELKKMKEMEKLNVNGYNKN